LDGDTSTDQVPPTQVYQQGDDVVTYDIVLTVTNYCGSEVVSDVVTVFPQPVAAFGTDYDEFCTPWPAEINNNSVGNPDTYLWDFGDGQTSTLAEPLVHTFYTDTIPTSYTITLITTNECGTDTAEYTITVLPNTVTAFFNTNITQGCAPLTVEFTDFSDGGTVVAYDFGDDGISNNPNPIHTYTEPGDYTIYQYVNNGCSFDTTTAFVTVFPVPTMDFTTEEPGVCANTPTQFINLSEDVNNVIWDFGDGTTTDETNPLYTYEEGGTYVVTLTGTSMFNECEASIQMPYTVYDAPEANLAVQSQVGCAPFDVVFNNTTSGALFYNWDFGDGETGVGQNVSHTFENTTGDPLAYTVMMIAQNIQLCADTSYVNIVVSPTPQALFELSETESCYAPFEISTTNNSLFANGYEWSFAPFGSSSAFEPDFSIDLVGTWNVTLLASNAYGCEDAMTQQVTVHPLPVADFTSSQPYGCIDLPVSFTSLATGAASVEWTFGDGETSFNPNPQHVYDEDGYFTVQLVAISNAGCTDTLVVENMIAAYPLPIAQFSFSPDEANIYNADIQFEDQSLNPYAWTWNFGDGYFSSEQNPAHTYQEAGSYGIELIITNIYGCEDRDYGSITIEDQFNIYVPNAFTPDNDGVNDVFFPVVVGKDMLDFYELRVFDRWGMLLFETNNPEDVWLGDFRRHGDYYVQNDVYVWQVKIRLKGAEKSELLEGHVNQIR
jgi:gliding motility-associated-like protein